MPGPEMGLLRPRALVSTLNLPLLLGGKQHFYLSGRQGVPTRSDCFGDSFFGSPLPGYALGGF